MNQEHVIQAVQRWVETVVVGLNLCPFAKKEMVRNRIRYVASDANSIESLLQVLESELLRLNTDQQTETTLLIHPCVLTDFHDYNQFLNVADDLLEEMELDGVYQVASFHPDYQFSGTEPDDAENYSNRSPYPLLHLLREDSLEHAIDEFPDTGNIPERNIAFLKELGGNNARRLLQACTAENTD